MSYDFTDYAVVHCKFCVLTLKKMGNLLYPVSLCQTLVKSENRMAAIYKINFTKNI